MRIPGRSTGTIEVPIPDHDPGADTSFEKAFGGETGAIPLGSHTDCDSESFTPGAQEGVLRIEATTTVWTRNALITAYVL